MIHRPVAAEARPNYRLWVRFEDGVEGEADLSDVAGRGVFQRWTETPSEFAEVAIDPLRFSPHCGIPRLDPCFRGRPLL